MKVTAEDLKMTELNDAIEVSEDGQNSFSLDQLLFLLKKILSSWKFILIIASISALIGFGIAASIPKSFVSTAIVAPELTSRNTAGSLSTLANLAGFKTNSLAVTDAMHPDMYPSIVNSTDFLFSLFDMPVEVCTKDGKINTSLFDYITNYQKSPWWNTILGFPFLIKDKIVSLFKDDSENDLAVSGSDGLPIMLSKEQRSVISYLNSSINLKVEKKTYLLVISAKMQDRVIAANLVNEVVNQLQRFVIDYRGQRNKENVAYYTKMADDAKEEYLKAQREYARYVDTHQSVSLNSYKINVQRLQEETNLRYQMYNSMSQNLLQAEAKLQLETPILYVIQRGLAPIKGSPSKMLFMLIAFVLGTFIGGALVLFKEFLHLKKTEELC